MRLEVGDARTRDWLQDFVGNQPRRYENNIQQIEAIDLLGFRAGKRVVAVVIPEFRMHQLLRAHALYEKDVNYVVQDGDVLVVLD